jgi:4-amino-4-deoxy-L-arabinose transferase-like glycosyltransferase
VSKRLSTALALLALLLVAAALRFHGLNWDQGIGAHPDERYIVDVAGRLSFPGALNPFDVAPHFAYGHLPLYLLALVSALAPKVDPLLLGRALSASCDLGTVALTFALGRRLYDTRAGLLGGAVVGLTVAHVQQAHFYTPDTLLALLAVGALLFSVRFAQNGRPLDLWLAGGFAGLALGTKASAGLLVIPLGVACSSPSRGERRVGWRCGLAAVLAFLAVDPFALIELPRFLGNLAEQAAILRGVADVPYTRQYHGTLPYIYPMVQQLRWGMGWLAGSAALVGLACEGVRAVRHPSRTGPWIVLIWVVPYFCSLGALYAKFPRYMLPLIPVLAILASHLLTDLARWRRSLLPILAMALLGSLLVRCLAVAMMYRVPHPWMTASDWLYQHVPRGSTIAVEAWDHPLPLDARGYDLVELPIFGDEATSKWEAMDRALGEADYVIIASRRGYASLARWPDRYPQTARYYRRLFDGDLGFEPVACFGRSPHLGSFALKDDPTAELAFSLPGLCEPAGSRALRLGRLDESFVVYDHPQTVILKASE